MSLKVTPLMTEHQKCKAHFVDFHGWKLPLRFRDASKEHLQVRHASGLFDISYMSKIRIKGASALQTLEKLVTNNIGLIQKNQAQYNLLCNEQGGILDDAIVYCLEFQKDYLLVANGSQREKVYRWIKKHKLPESHIQDESEKWAMLALQGPLAPLLLANTLGIADVQNIKRYHFKKLQFLGENILVAATGYTGEKGFEVLVPFAKATTLWQFILNQGKGDCWPIGLAARDTLRLEMKYPLYGQDLQETTHPYSAGLAWAIKNPKNFIGKKSMLNFKKQTKWVGFQIKQISGLARYGHKVLANGELIGKVTSGAMSPCLQYIIGVAYVDLKWCSIGQKIQIAVHHAQIPAEIVATPFINQYSLKKSV